MPTARLQRDVRAPGCVQTAHQYLGPRSTGYDAYAGPKKASFGRKIRNETGGRTAYCPEIDGIGGRTKSESTAKINRLKVHRWLHVNGRNGLCANCARAAAGAPGTSGKRVGGAPGRAAESTAFPG